jgi:DNA-directed RNA polymerase subunit RPC12/RpoP
MGEVIFNCGGCSRPLSAQEEHVGMLVACPVCGGQMVVPGGTTLPTAPSPALDSAPGLAPGPALGSPLGPVLSPKPKAKKAAGSYATLGFFIILFAISIVLPKQPPLFGIVISVLGLTGLCGAVITLMRLFRK